MHFRATLRKMRIKKQKEYELMIIFWIILMEQA